MILATGFRAALDPLAGIVTRDARGFARRSDRVTSAEQPGLYFVGHEYDASGGIANIRHDAPWPPARSRPFSEPRSMSGFPPGISLPDPATAALLLAFLTGLFALRVAGQAIVARWSPRGCRRCPSGIRACCPTRSCLRCSSSCWC